MRTVGIIQARINSQRLPGKVVYEFAGQTILSFMISRVKQTESINDIVVATGMGMENDVIEYIANENGVQVFRGDENDVLSRFLGAARYSKADIIIRLTGDCPLVDPNIITQTINFRNKQNLDFCTNVKPPSWPDGLDVSVFTFQTLELAAKNASLKSEREHVVPWMWKQSNFENGLVLRAGNVVAPFDMSTMRWTLDEPRDYMMLQQLVSSMGSASLLTANCIEITQFLKKNPEIAKLNQGIERDKGYKKSIVNEKIE